MGVREFTPEELDAFELSAPAIDQQRYARMVQQRIAFEHGLTVATLRGPSHDRFVVEARRSLYRHLRSMGWSYPAIGKFIGRDHTTILAALRPRPLAKGRG